ncbi:DUF4012 domain-containing protein [Subtercola sp. PAMC28395]|uniref:DUF4012 domain-containing protein n=1 Tax=Subtercola sp. PAMC28395 TaxID=2846775 RepID=UPI001C0BE385|nr:DUF4012 domain-containing protein [Subtercola sp. PAMC28395]QWT25035.1 DUF4012 domain-containing protein [Subtercola sp. PAMC28395]
MPSIEPADSANPRDDDSREPESRVTRRAERRQRSPKRRRRIIVWSTISVVVIALACVVGWVAFQTLQAKSELEAAQTSVSEIQTQLSSLDTAGLATSATDFAAHAHAASMHTDDPLYRLAEALPVVGPNLAAVRELSSSLDQLGSTALMPVVDFSKTLSPDSLRPHNGAVNTALLTTGDATLASADASLVEQQATVAAIDTSNTVGQIVSAQKQMTAALSKAHDQITKVRSTLATAEGILGMNGTRHYVLAFLNNAETTALGGGPASLSLLTVDNGAFSITDQGSSQNFPTNDGPVRDIDPNLINLYSTGINSTLNWSTARPDFPTAGETIKAWWEKYKPEKVDGVISINPIALSQLLAVTGPVTLASGEQITAENAVSLLLHDIYLRYPANEIQAKTDVFFADAAKSIFAGLTTTTADPQALLGALNTAIDSGNIMAWSPVAAEQKLMDGSKLQGVLPNDNTKSTVVGTYFRDVSVSKTDFWLETATDLTTDVCQNSENPTFTVTTTLHSTITPEEASSLAPFVTGAKFKGKKFSTEVFVYGPVDAHVTLTNAGSTSVYAVDVGNAGDLGRPVAHFEVDLAPGETNTVTATFQGAAGAYGPPVFTATPMMNPTKTTMTAAGCK